MQGFGFGWGLFGCWEVVGAPRLPGCVCCPLLPLPSFALPLPGPRSDLSRRRRALFEVSGIPGGLVFRGCKVRVREVRVLFRGFRSLGGMGLRGSARFRVQVQGFCCRRVLTFRFPGLVLNPLGYPAPASGEPPAPDPRGRCHRRRRPARRGSAVSPEDHFGCKGFLHWPGCCVLRSSLAKPCTMSVAPQA